jgi:predicted N-formylglutamate amidohydrolase
VLHTLNLHAAHRGLPHVMIEMCNDLVAEERGQDEWAELLSASLTQASAH